MTITARVDRNNPPFDVTYPLSAGVAKVLVFDLGDSTNFALSLRNTLLVNPIDTTTIDLGLADADASYQTQTAVNAAIGSIAASAGVTGIATYDKFDDGFRYVRVTVTSTSGTSVRVQARAT